MERVREIDPSVAGERRILLKKAQEAATEDRPPGFEETLVRGGRETPVYQAFRPGREPS